MRAKSLPFHLVSHKPPEPWAKIYWRANMSAAYPRYSYIISKYVWRILFSSPYPRVRGWKLAPCLAQYPNILSSSLQLILLYRASAHETKYSWLNKKRTLDPLFALTIGLCAATLRIQREERAAGRNGDLIAIGKKGWDMVANSTEGVLGFWMRDGRGRVWYFQYWEVLHLWTAVVWKEGARMDGYLCLIPCVGVVGPWLRGDDVESQIFTALLQSELTIFPLVANVFE